MRSRATTRVDSQAAAKGGAATATRKTTGHEGAADTLATTKTMGIGVEGSRATEDSLPWMRMSIARSPAAAVKRLRACSRAMSMDILWDAAGQGGTTTKMMTARNVTARVVGEASEEWIRSASARLHLAGAEQVMVVDDSV